jgi:negative regulator of sigma E activity
MSAAALTIPVNVRTPAQVAALAKILNAAVGSSDVTVDPTAGKATLRYEFPGDIDPLMRMLYQRGLANSATLAVSVAVQPVDGAAVNPAALVARLNAAPTVSYASYDGKTVSATIAAATEALRDLHARIVAVGLALR